LALAGEAECHGTVSCASCCSRARRSSAFANAPWSTSHLYLNLLRSAERLGGKLEVGAAIGRVLVSRLSSGRGALHVRQPVVLAAGGLRWRGPPYDNSFATFSYIASEFRERPSSQEYGSFAIVS
jgi:hypothetical protein